MNSLMIASQVCLWLVVLCLLLAVFALARQIGVLHQRIPPAGARTTADGPKIGDSAPPLEAVDLLGRAVTLGVERAKATLLVFIAPGCPACSALIPGVQGLWRSERKYLEVVILSTISDEVRNREFFDSHKVIRDMPYVVSPNLAAIYQVMMPPYAVFVGADGTVKSKGMVNCLEHLESLVTAARLGHPTVESLMHAQGAAPHAAA